MALGTVGSGIAAAGVMGSAAFAIGRYAPEDGLLKEHGLPDGGPLDSKDLKVAAGLTGFGLVMGAPMGLIGAVVGNAPGAQVGPMMLIGLIATPAIGAGAALGIGMRE